MKQVCNIKEKVNQDPLTCLIRSGAKDLIAKAVEAELLEYKKVFEQDLSAQGHKRVVRNGYQPERDIQTGIGPVSVKIPKVRARWGDSACFQSSLVPPFVRKTKSLEAALPWLYLKGISSGQICEALQVLVGPEAKGLSSSVISRLKQTWSDEYKDFRKRNLSNKQWVYIWADGVYSGLRNEDTKLCALVIIGVEENGNKELLAIEDGMRESTQSWNEVLLQLKQQGMNAPKLAIGDGAMGFWSALDQVYPKTRHQRCWVHKIKNVLNCLPKKIQPKAKSMLHDIYMAESKKDAQKALALFIKIYKDKYPKAVKKLADQETLLTFFDFPASHWQSIRTSNPIESTFATIRHRTKKTRGCLSRNTMLSMMFKLGICAQGKWRKLRGFVYLAKIIQMKNFVDGIEQDELENNNNQQTSHAA